VREHSFRLVVRGVRNGDAIHVVLFHKVGEKCIPSAASRIFQIGLFALGFRRDVGMANVESQSMPGCEIRNKFLIRIRQFAAQFVIEMHDTRHDPELLTQLKQKQEQSDGIRSTGRGHAQAVPSPYCVLEEIQDVLRQRCHTRLPADSFWSFANHESPVASHGFSVPIAHRSMAERLKEMLRKTVENITRLLTFTRATRILIGL
jgi:hypothetical protein